MSRKTKQLEVIWEAVKDDSSHPTADQIYERVRKSLPKISLGTVYRNLQKLVVDDKLQVVMLGRSQRFDPLMEGHQHFICEACGQVYDFFVDPCAEIEPVKFSRNGFRVTSRQLAFYGTCKHCAP